MACCYWERCIKEGFSRENVHETVLLINDIFFKLFTLSGYIYPLQVENSRLVVDEDDNGKIRLERIKRRSRL